MDRAAYACIATPLPCVQPHNHPRCDSSLMNHANALADNLGYSSLKQRHRQVRHEHPTHLALRTHRALSWLNRAEQTKDVDGRFIFLWISFNTAYAQELDGRDRMPDQFVFMEFLEKLCHLDKEKRISLLIWNEFSQSIRLLLDNPYVFQPFWEYQCGRIDKDRWQAQFSRAKKAAHSALARGNTPALLSILFNRLYTLRNQLIHGGATWNSRINRSQLQDCTTLLSELVPIIIELMMENPETLWGAAVYPVVDAGT